MHELQVSTIRRKNMETNGIQNSGQNPVYDDNFLKGAKPKDEKTTRSLFNALWDEAGKMIDEADANGDGKVDKSDLPMLNQLIKNLQAGQKFINKNIKKFSFDAEKFRSGFQICEQNIQKAVEQITSGEYVSPKSKVEQKQQGQVQPTASYEPDETDADIEKFNNAYYHAMAQKGQDILSELAKEKDSIASEEKWYTKHGQPYYGRTQKQAGESAMKEIIKEFLPRTQQGNYMLPDKDDAHFLNLWANQQFSGGKITLAEKNMLDKAAKSTLAEIASKETKEQNQEVADDVIDNSPNNQVLMPKYDSKNDGHDSVWEAVGIKEES